jgi:AraC family transcriptional regulator
VRESTQTFYEAAVDRCVRTIVDDLDAAVDLHELAAMAATSPFHFHRIFRGMVGETPLGLSRRLRLERAAHRLVSTDTPVVTIAFASGFESHESFSRAFRDAFALSPSAYRRSGIDRVRLAAPCGVHFHPDGATPFTPITGGPPMDVHIVERPERRIAAVLHVGPYDRIGEAFDRLGQIGGPAGLFAGTDLDGPPEMVAIYDDDPEGTPAAELRSHAGVTVGDEVDVPAGLETLTLPAGSYACVTHVGSYEGLGDAWARLLGVWLPSSGRRLGPGGAFESYRNTPADTAPDDLRTDLYVHLV